MSTDPKRLPPIDYISRTAEQYRALGFDAYRWVHSATPPPFVHIDKPMSEWRVGLVASGGIYAKGQIAFTHRDDISIRKIAWDTPESSLRATHFAYDLKDARMEPRVVFPISALREMERDGTIGGLSEYALTFMGGIYSSRKVREFLGPAIVKELSDMSVDVALMVPV